MAIRTIVALFDDYREAEGAVRELESMGVPSTDMNLIANNAGNRYGNYPQYGIDRPTRTDDTASGAGTGAVLGGAAGLLAGIGALAIPGGRAGGGRGCACSDPCRRRVGAAVGGLVGALVEAGIARERADIYAEAVRRGGTLVTVRTDDGLSDRVSDILNRHSPIDIEKWAESWQQAGWRGFDERAEPYPGSSSADRPLRTDLETRPEARAAGAGELQRDWEVKRDPAEVRQETGRNYVRIYPPVEAPVSDKR